MNKNAHLQPGVTAGLVPEEGARVHLEMRSRNKKERLTWLKDAGFGLFIHWSLDVQLGCVISHSLVGASKAYSDRFYETLPQTLEDGEWDFDHIAHLARLAGCCYAVLTTKHHNGFCLWPTKTTPFNSMNTAIGRDLVKAYVEAMRRQNIAVGLYFSPEDFWFLREHGQTITREPKEPYPPEVEKAYREHLTAQVRELMSQYGKIDVLFFDGGENMILEDGKSLQDVCMETAWDMDPDVLITRGAIPTPEQRVVEESEVNPDADQNDADDPWEVCFTIGTAWQHQPTNEHYKTGKEIITLLMDTRAKGGTLLLNIGPDEKGRVVPAEEGVLREVGLWHFINEECVHDVRPWWQHRDNDCLMVQAKDGTAVFAVDLAHAFLRGEREEVVLTSVGLSDESEISILGSANAFVEYHPEIDAGIYAEEKADGLHLSLLRAQRIYCGSMWQNPLVIKITHPVRKTYEDHHPDLVSGSV